MSSYYDILKIQSRASAEEIKSAYKRLALLYHPDRNEGRVEAEEKFKQINEAYKTLSNSSKRKKYDEKYGFKQSSTIHYKYHEGGIYRSITNNFVTDVKVEYPQKQVFKSKKRDVDFYLFWLTLAMIFILVAGLIYKL